MDGDLVANAVWVARRYAKSGAGDLVSEARDGIAGVASGPSATSPQAPEHPHHLHSVGQAKHPDQVAADEALHGGGRPVR